jgi:cytochrome b561
MDRHYSPLSRILHWLGAMAVIVMLTLGFMMFFADSREVKHFSEAAHIVLAFLPSY